MNNNSEKKNYIEDTRAREKGQHYYFIYIFIKVESDLSNFVTLWEKHKMTMAA